MTLPNYNNEPKDNKSFDHRDKELLYLKELLQDYLAVALYKCSSTKEITNVIHYQIKNDYKILTIKCSYFQENKAILFLIHEFLEEEIDKALKYALEITFVCDLSRKKIIIEHDYCTYNFW